MILGQSPVHLELAQVADVRLLVLAEGDVPDDGRALEFQRQVLWGIVGGTGRGSAIENGFGVSIVVGGLLCGEQTCSIGKTGSSGSLLGYSCG